MYRITDSDRLYEIGWEEYVDSDALCIVEWSENIEDALPPDCWKITIEKLSETDRKIRVIKC
jgi:tRNA threonylcarbamoyladenosine biosynthesis protein TsaE